MFLGLLLLYIIARSLLAHLWLEVTLWSVTHPVFSCNLHARKERCHVYLTCLNSRKQQVEKNNKCPSSLVNLFNAPRSVASKVDDREAHGRINFRTSPSSLKSRLIHDVGVVGVIILRMCVWTHFTAGTTEQVQQSM